MSDMIESIRVRYATAVDNFLALAGPEAEAQEALHELRKRRADYFRDAATLADTLTILGEPTSFVERSEHERGSVLWVGEQEDRLREAVMFLRSALNHDYGHASRLRYMPETTPGAIR